MIIFLTTVFVFAYFNALTMPIQNKMDMALWGAVVLLAGVYFSIQEARQITKGE